MTDAGGITVYCCAPKPDRAVGLQRLFLLSTVQGKCSCPSNVLRPQVDVFSLLLLAELKKKNCSGYNDMKSDMTSWSEQAFGVLN